MRSGSRPSATTSSRRSRIARARSSSVGSVGYGLLRHPASGEVGSLEAEVVVHVDAAEDLDGFIVCSQHSSRYDVTTGECVHPSEGDGFAHDLMVFETEVVEDVVRIRL
jgi:hypothetical protein